MAQIVVFDKYHRQLQRNLAANAEAVAGPTPPQPACGGAPECNPRAPGSGSDAPIPTPAQTAAPGTAAAAGPPWWVGTSADPNGPAVLSKATTSAPTISDAVSYVLAQASGLLPWLLVAAALYLGWRYWRRRGGRAHV